MKKIFTQIMMFVALFMAATTVDAQGIKVIKKDGTVLEIPAAELDRIETYEAQAQGKFYEGAWKMKQLVTDKDAMDAAWGGMATYDDAFPAFNAADQLTFGDSKLTPALSSAFKNFFIGDATIEELPDTYTLRTGMGDPLQLTILKLTGVNRNFDANSKSENNVAYIGVREIEDEDADVPGVMLLDVYLIDYESTSFAKELLDFGMYGPDSKGNPYVAYMTGMFINFTMEKVNSDVAPVEKKFYEGAWTMNKLVTDKDAMDAAWGGMATYDESFPAFNAADKLTINGGKLSPALSSAFKNFFIGDATIEELPDTYPLKVGMGDALQLTILKLTGVNRNFDANSKSENNVAYIGVREIEDEDADVPGVMLLDVYLIDYESTSFAKELLDFGMYGPDSKGNPYVAYMSGMFINFTMKK